MRRTISRRGGFSEDARRQKATKLSVDEALPAAAKAHGINLSQTLEEALRDKLREIEQRRGLEENREAIENHNRYTAKYGAFSDGRRRFRWRDSMCTGTRARTRNMSPMCWMCRVA